MNDLLAWKLAGVDDYTIAQTAAMVAVQNLTAKAADITATVTQGAKAEDIIAAINEALNDLCELKEQAMFNDFEAFCVNWRSANQDKIIAALSGGVGNG